MKIGIFGGSFNPPHNMHKLIALRLIELNLVDKVIFVPTGNRYDKKDLVDAKYRYDMVKIICNYHKRLEVSDFEIRNNLVFTYQTLDYFREKYKNDEILFIIGADNLSELYTWNRYEYLLKSYKFLVIKRQGENIDNLLKKYNYNSNIIITNIDMNDISSTKIREMIKNQDKEVCNYIDKNVFMYILINRLYLKPASYLL